MISTVIEDLFFLRPYLKAYLTQKDIKPVKRKFTGITLEEFIRTIFEYFDFFSYIYLICEYKNYLTKGIKKSN